MPFTLDISKEPNLIVKQIINEDGKPFIDMPICNVLVYKKDKQSGLIKELVQLVEQLY